MQQEWPIRPANANQDVPDQAPGAAPPQEETRWAGDHDVQLMLRLREGDQGAFEQLVQRNTHKVHALVYRFLGDPQQVDDLTQEVFLRIYRTAANYRPSAKFSTWLYRIVANLCFNVHRSRRKGRPVSLDLVGQEDGESYHRDVPDDRLPEPGHDMDHEELQRKVAAAISQLPENQRIAIILNKYENKSYEEIAQVLRCTTMAVKSLLSRARSNLRELLARYVDQG